MRPGETVNYEGDAYLWDGEAVEWDHPITLKRARYLIDDVVFDNYGLTVYLTDISNISVDEAPTYAVKGEDFPE